MSIKKFDKKDIFVNKVKAHPEMEFWFYDRSLYLRNEYSKLGSHLNKQAGNFFDNPQVIIDNLNPFAYWSGTDLERLYQSENTSSPVTTGSQNVQRWEDQISTLPLTVANDAPIYNSGAFGIEFDQATALGGLLDEGLANTSTFSFLHGGIDASVFVRFEILNFVIATTTYTPFFSTRRNAGGQTGFSFEYRSAAGGQLRTLISNGVSTFQFVVPTAIGTTGTVNAVLSLSSTGISSSINGGAFSAESPYGAFTPSAASSSFGLSVGADPVALVAPVDMIIKEVVVKNTIASAQDVLIFNTYNPAPAFPI